MNNFSVCGVDIGNITSIFSGDIQSKSELIIESRLERYSIINELGDNEIFEIEGEKWIVNQGNFKNEHLKFKKDNFLNLLYYGMAKTCIHSKVKLVLGIPAGQYNEYNKELKKFIKENNFKKVILGVGNMKTTRQIYIEDVIIRPESYGIKNLRTINECIKGVKTLIVDIGGGTTDIAIFDERMKFVGGETLDIGLLELYNSIRKYISIKYCKVTLEDTKKIVDGQLKMINIEDYSFIKEYQNDFMNKVLNEFKGEFPNAISCNIVLAGGGGEIGYDYFKNAYSQTIKVSDICVNAKSFYIMGVKKWQQ